MIAEEFEYLGNIDFSDTDETILYLHFLFKNGDYGETIQVISFGPTNPSMS